MLEQVYELGFRARLHAKDARIVIDTAKEASAPVPSFEVVVAQLDRLVEEGGGDMGHSALHRLLRDTGVGSEG